MFYSKRFLLAVILGLFSVHLATAGGFRPDRLLLTWKEDPSTTMVIQWLQTGDPLELAESSTEETIRHFLPAVTGWDAHSEWWSQARSLDFLADDEHRINPAPDFGARAYAGWNEDGLLLRLIVSDPEVWEHPEADRLWDGDGVEIFVSDPEQPRERVQIVLTPGRPAGLESRTHFYGRTVDGGAVTPAVDYQTEVTDGGYELEIMLPWANLLSFEPAGGREILLQIYVNRRDAEGENFKWVGLHSSRLAAGTITVGETFVLSNDPVPPTPWIRTEIESPANEVATLRLYASPEAAGSPISLYTGDIDLGTTTFTADEDRSIASLAVPFPPEGRRWGTLKVSMEETVFTLPSPQSAVYQFRNPDPMELRVWPAEGEEASAVSYLTAIAPVPRWDGKFRQRVYLNGLEPDTAYRFRVGVDALDYGFRTMPATLNRPIRFATGGDTRHRQDWMERVNRVALAYEPEFIVWGGDLAYADGLADRVYRWQEWFDANYNALLNENRDVIPIVVAIGNHEVRGGYYTAHADYEQTDEFRDSIAPFFYSLFAFPGHPGWGALDFGDYLSFVILDTAHSNPIPGIQTEWLAGALAERSHFTHLFPVYHVPAFPSHRPYDGRFAAEIREHWIPLFEEHGVRIAFENHDHTYKRTHPIRGEAVADDGIIYFGDGAWGVGVRSGDSKDEWYIDQFASERHAIIVTLDGDQCHFLVVNEEGEVIDELRDPQ